MAVEPGKPAEIAVMMDMGTNDPLAPSDFVREVVEHMEKFEDLEGDGDMMKQKLMGAINQHLEHVKENGGFENGNVAHLQMMVRDPNDGEGTLLINAKVEHDGNGFKIEANPCWSHINQADFSEKGRAMLGDFANGVLERFDLDYGVDGTDEFVKENANNYTYSVGTTYDPGAPGS